MAIIETEALVLRTYKLAEADKIVVCLTNKSGLVRGVARGARRLKSRFGASLEPWTLIDLTYYEKEGRELVSFNSAEIARSYFDLAVEPETSAALEYMSELTLEFMPPGEPNERMLRMMKAVAETLALTASRPKRLLAVTRYFEIWTLRLGGFLPSLRVCANCQRPLLEATTVHLDIDNAVRCGACAGGASARLSAGLMHQLHLIACFGPGEYAVRGDALSNEARTELSDFTGRVITRLLERVPRGRDAVSLMPHLAHASA